MTQRKAASQICFRRFHSEQLEPRCVLAADSVAAIFELRLEAFDLAGNPIEQVEVGGEFEVRMLASDLRTSPDAGGLFSVYADLVYRSGMIETISGDGDSPVTYGEAYPSAQRADLSKAGVINEVGAVSGFNPVGTDEVLVASVRFRAVAAGTSRFGLDTADDRLQHPILAYGLNYVETPDSNRETVFRGTTLQILGADGTVVADDGWLPSLDSTRTATGDNLPPDRTPMMENPATSLPDPPVQAEVGRIELPQLSDPGESVLSYDDGISYRSADSFWPVIDVVMFHPTYPPTNMVFVRSGGSESLEAVLALPPIHSLAAADSMNSPAVESLDGDLFRGQSEIVHRSSEELLNSIDRANAGVKGLDATMADRRSAGDVDGQSKSIKVDVPAFP